MSTALERATTTLCVKTALGRTGRCLCIPRRTAAGWLSFWHSRIRFGIPLMGRVKRAGCMRGCEGLGGQRRANVVFAGDLVAKTNSAINDTNWPQPVVRRHTPFGGRDAAQMAEQFEIPSLASHPARN